MTSEIDQNEIQVDQEAISPRVQRLIERANSFIDDNKGGYATRQTTVEFNPQKAGELGLEHCMYVKWQMQNGHLTSMISVRSYMPGRQDFERSITAMLLNGEWVAYQTLPDGHDSIPADQPTVESVLDTVDDVLVIIKDAYKVHATD